MRDCRGCHGTLDPILNLGDIQLTGYLAPDEPARPTAPLFLCACSECTLVQLAHTVPRDLLFTQYWYRSAVNETMQAELAGLVDQAVARVGGLRAGDLVLDIGANDGTLLSRYPTYEPQVMRLAYEPAENLQPSVRQHADLVLPEYFPDQFRQIHTLGGQVRIITSIAMIYAVDDLAPFLTAVAALLAPDGVWIVQFQDLAGMLKMTAFDNIVHEHLCYFSLESFANLLGPYGLTVTDAEHRTINGGSLRLTVQHRGQPVSPRVARLRAEEAGCQDWASLERFAWRVEVATKQIRAAIALRRTAGRVVDLYGASTKANTLLQVCGLTRAWLRQAWERSPEKVGLRTAGTDIPIVSEETGRAEPPDALLVGIWQFRPGVVLREAAFLDGGGTLIFPLPAVDLVSQRWRRHAHA